MAMVRKQLYLPEKTNRLLKKEAKRRGISEAALIRERLDHVCELEPKQIDEEARARFLETIRAARREAGKNLATGNTIEWKFNRGDVYEERLERQMPR